MNSQDHCQGAGEDLTGPTKCKMWLAEELIHLNPSSLDAKVRGFAWLGNVSEARSSRFEHVLGLKEG